MVRPDGRNNGMRCLRFSWQTDTSSAPAASLQDICVVQVLHVHLDRKRPSFAARPIIACSSPPFSNPAAQPGPSLSIASDNAGSVWLLVRTRVLATATITKAAVVQQYFTFSSCPVAVIAHTYRKSWASILEVLCNSAFTVALLRLARPTRTVDVAPIRELVPAASHFC